MLGLQAGQRRGVWHCWAQGIPTAASPAHPTRRRLGLGGSRTTDPLQEKPQTLSGCRRQLAAGILLQQQEYCSGSNSKARLRFNVPSVPGCCRRKRLASGSRSELRWRLLIITTAWPQLTPSASFRRDLGDAGGQGSHPGPLAVGAAPRAGARVAGGLGVSALQGCPGAALARSRAEPPLPGCGVPLVCRGCGVPPRWDRRPPSLATSSPWLVHPREGLVCPPARCAWPPPSPLGWAAGGRGAACSPWVFVALAALEQIYSQREGFGS